MTRRKQARLRRKLNRAARRRAQETHGAPGYDASGWRRWWHQQHADDPVWALGWLREEAAP